MRFRLKYSLPFLVAIFVVAVIAITYGNSRTLVVAEAEHALETQLRGDLNLLQGTVQRFLMLGDDEGIRNAVSGLGASVYTKVAMVVGYDGVVKASSHLVDVGRHWSELGESLDAATIERLNVTRGTEVKHEHANSIVAGYSSVCDALRGGQLRLTECGFIYLRATTTHRVQQSLLGLRYQAFYMGVGTLIMALLLLLGFHLLITRRLQRMLWTMTAFGEGDRSARALLPPADEFGQIACALDNLIEQVVDDEANLRLASMVFEHASEAIVITDVECRIIDVNPAYEAMTGYRRDEVLGANPSVSRSDRHDQTFYAAMWRQIRETGGWRGEIWDRRKTGEVFPSRLTITAIKNAEGTVTHYVGIFNDISQQKANEEMLERLAYFDPLTRLPNRALFLERLRHHIAQAQRDGRPFALLFLDLDRFKYVNDTLGHTVGDELLVEVAGRIERCVRNSDTVARLSGDEFTVIVSNFNNVQGCAVVAAKIIDAVSEKFVIRGHDLHVGLSIGVAVYPEDGTDRDVLIKNADTAMYQAKEAGRGVYKFFTEEMNARTVRRVTMERSIRQGLERGEFEVHYQPKVSLANDRVVGLEALLRWQHEGRMISPVEFIPVAEDTGLILPLGDAVLDRVGAQLRAWSDERSVPVYPVAVNLSGKQLQQRVGLVKRLAATLERHGVAASLLEVEITESMIMTDLNEAIAIMEQLGAMGVGIAIDDFGTGYSSLSYLKRFPIDALKIDRSFIADIETDADDAAIVASIISMAKDLKLSVVAEGVETTQQLAYLRDKGCDVAQGYLFAKPMAAQHYVEWLRDWNRDHSALPDSANPRYDTDAERGARFGAHAQD